jgi:hypothetical protein
MFNEITGNTDLYEQFSDPCALECRESCLRNCDGYIPTVAHRIQDFLNEEAIVQP